MVQVEIPSHNSMFGGLPIIEEEISEEQLYQYTRYRWL
jgi:hypothetical protein